MSVFTYINESCRCLQILMSARHLTEAAATDVRIWTARTCVIARQDMFSTIQDEHVKVTNMCPSYISIVQYVPRSPIPRNTLRKII